jgi:hypothetical protein
MYGPALKSLLAKSAGPEEQGALQGHITYIIACYMCMCASTDFVI